MLCESQYLLLCLEKLLEIMDMATLFNLQLNSLIVKS